MRHITITLHIDTDTALPLKTIAEVLALAVNDPAGDDTGLELVSMETQEVRSAKV